MPFNGGAFWGEFAYQHSSEHQTESSGAKQQLFHLTARGQENKGKKSRAEFQGGNGSEESFTLQNKPTTNNNKKGTLLDI